MTRELPKSEFPISERKSIDSSGPRESEGPGGSSLLGEGQVASKIVPDSIHPNSNLLNQFPYQLELPLTYLQTMINGKKNSIISIETRIYIYLEFEINYHKMHQNLPK